MDGRNRPDPLFSSASVHYKEDSQKKEAAPRSGLSLGRKRPRRAYGDKSPRFLVYGAPHKKHVHVHYLHGCDILASHPSPSAPFGGSRRSIAILARMRLASFPTRFDP